MLIPWGNEEVELDTNGDSGNVQMAIALNSEKNYPLIRVQSNFVPKYN